VSRSLKPYDYVLYFTIIGVKLYIFESFLFCCMLGLLKLNPRKYPGHSLQTLVLVLYLYKR
jgi:hypothetical protein